MMGHFWHRFWMEVCHAIREVAEAIEEWVCHHHKKRHLAGVKIVWGKPRPVHHRDLIAKFNSMRAEKPRP